MAIILYNLGGFVKYSSAVSIVLRGIRTLVLSLRHGEWPGNFNEGTDTGGINQVSHCESLPAV